MRPFLVFMLMLSPTMLAAQADLWKNVNENTGPTRLDRADVTESERRELEALFRAKDQTKVWECNPAQGAPALLNGLSFSTIAVADGKKGYLVEAGAGCARGGQGSNGAMWLVELGKAGPVLLATPKERFGGWLFSVQPSASHGYRDVILGWHMSASEAGLTYFRFDGRRYQQVGGADAKWDEDGHLTVTPEPAHQ